MSGLVDGALKYIANQVGKSDSNWQIINSYQCKVKKKNGIVFVKGLSQAEMSLTAGSYTTIATLPVGYRPQDSIYFSCTTLGGQGILTGMLTTGGVLQIHSTVSTSYWSYSFSFPL